MKKISKLILKFEEIFVSILIAVITILVFWSAVARTVGKPINWAQDIALLAFAWLTFIGGDLICRSNMLINIDMFINIFPNVLKKIIAIVFDIAMLIFLAVLIVNGYILVTQSWSRMFNTLALSYAWATMAVPVGSSLMFITITGRLISDFKKPIEEWGL